MKAKATFAATLVLLILASTSTQADVYSGLQFSASATDEWVEEVPPFTGQMTVYVWYWGWDSLDGYEFGLTGSLQVVSVAPSPGFVNVGTTGSPLIMSQTGCVDGSNGGVVIATVVVEDATGAGGNLCFDYADSSGRLCAHKCSPGGGWVGLFGINAFSSGGTTCPAIDLGAVPCAPVAVEPTTWGSVKASYQSSN